MSDSSDPEKIDSENPEWTDAMFAKARKGTTAARRLGRPKAEMTKERITIRLSPEVVESFRATGKGWQSRMDKALLDYLATHNQADIEGLG